MEDLEKERIKIEIDILKTISNTLLTAIFGSVGYIALHYEKIKAAANPLYSFHFFAPCTAIILLVIAIRFCLKNISIRLKKIYQSQETTRRT